jgi:signal transduction histidine kinase
VSATLNELAKDDPALRERLDDALQPLRATTFADVVRALAEATPAIVRCDDALIVITGPDGRREYRAAGGPGAPHSNDALNIPVLVRGARTGSLRLAGPHDTETFTKVDQRAGEVIAAALAGELERFRTLEQNRRRERWYTRGSQLARDIAAGRSPHALQTVVAQVGEIVEADGVAVLGSPGGGEEEAGWVRAAAGDDRPLRSLGASADGSSPDPAAVLRTGQPSRGESAGSSVLLVPLVTTRGPLGVLGLQRSPARPPFTPAEMGMAAMLAGQVALALELAEVQDHRDQIRLLEERDRIARDLHDHVIQRLFAIGMSLQQTGLRMSDEESGILRESVDEIDDAIRQIRATIYRLTGAIASRRLSIRTQAEQIVDDLEPALGFRPAVQSHGPIDLAVDDEEIVADCAAVLREALTNVARHAGATRVEVTISLDADALSIEVADDGRGMSEATRRSGLANLRTRAERHNGRLLVGPGHLGGTTVSWRIPIADVLRRSVTPD